MDNPPAQFATPSAPDSDGDGFAVTLGPAGLPPPPLLLTNALPNAAVGSAYSHNLVASGEVWGSVVWTPPGATGVPPGLQFANGTISGIPETPGTFAITLHAMEAANYSATMTQSVSLTVLSAWPGPPDFAVQLPGAIGLAGGNPLGCRNHAPAGRRFWSPLPMASLVRSSFQSPQTLSAPLPLLQTQFRLAR